MPAQRPAQFNKTAAKYAAYVAAALSLIGAAVIIGGAVTANTENNNDCSFSDLQKEIANLGNDSGQSDDIVCVEASWRTQRKILGYFVTFDLINAIANFAAVVVVLSLAEIYPSRAVELKFMVPCFIGASGIAAFELVSRAGTHTVNDWLSGDDWSLGADALRVLSISDWSSRGNLLWVVALDTLLIGVGFITTSSLTYRWGHLPTWHAHVGMAAGVLSCINFILEIARFGDWRLFSVIEAFSGAVVGLILAPLWIIVVGCYLDGYVENERKAALMYQDGEGAGDAPFGGTAGGASAAASAADVDLGSSADVGNPQL